MAAKTNKCHLRKDQTIMTNISQNYILDRIMTTRMRKEYIIKYQNCADHFGYNIKHIPFLLHKNLYMDLFGKYL